MGQKQKISTDKKALIKAAKIICDLKSGTCPIHEPNFFGCPRACTEEIRPWQCWVTYLVALSGNTTTTEPADNLPLQHAA